MAFRRAVYGLLLFLQAGLILTGGAVRLTGSGLGCPTWPVDFDTFFGALKKINYKGPITFESAN